MSILRPLTSFEDVYRKFKGLFQQHWVKIFILLGFCFFVFILGIGRWDLWNPDEPRYAQVAREMVNGGDWVLMHINGRIYADKPPLFFWLIGLSSYLWGGFTSFAVRFPAALFGTLTVLLTFFVGKNLYSSRTGLISGLILATSFEFAYLSTRANIDTTLTFLTTASILCFLLWFQRRKEEESSDEAMRGLLFLGFYIGMALATLVKGPIGFILPLLVSLIYLCIQKDWKGIRGMRLLPGMLLFLVIVLSWYLPAVLEGGKNYLSATLLTHSIDRFARGSSHIRPIYYYFINFPVGFLPWFLFLPGAIVYGLSKRKEGISREFLFLLVWFVLIFLFFSVSKGKRAIYLLPLYPAASLLVGRFCDDYRSGSGRHLPRKIWISLPVFIFIIFFFLMGIFLYAAPAVANFSVGPSSPKMLKTIVKGAGLAAEYLSYVPRWSVIPFIFLLLGSSVILFLAHGFRYKSLIFMLIVATVGIGFFYGTRFIFPMVNPYKSARFISKEITQTMKPGERLLMFGDFGSGGTAPYNFYTGIIPILEIEDEARVIDLFRSKERVFCLFKYRDYERLSGKYAGVFLNLITRRSVGDGDMAFVSNQ